jgi:NADH-quinone oxidoreductase subunit E
LCKERDALKMERDRLSTDLAQCRAKSVAAPVAVSAAPTHRTRRPVGLSAPRGGTGDDLKKINSVGPPMEKLLNSLGYYHFDQIAAWSPAETAWVDDNLEGFKGRATRDNWISQARSLS